MKSAAWSAAAAVFWALGAVACAASATVSEACERAALAQALAEQRFGDQAAEHAAHDETLLDNPGSPESLHRHDESSGRLVGARVDMLIAEAQTRRECG